MDAQREAAFHTLMDVERKSAFSNRALNKNIEKYNADHPAFVRELVYGVLENRILIDTFLDAYIKKGVKSARKQDLTVLRMGIYQIRWMDSVPEHAAVSESVKLAKKYCRGRDGFINGVLRAFLREPEKAQSRIPDRQKDPAGYLSVTYSCSRWLADMWIREQGFEKAESMLKASLDDPGLTIRVNTLKTTPDELAEKLRSMGYEIKKCSHADAGLHVAAPHSGRSGSSGSFTGKDDPAESRGFQQHPDGSGSDEKVSSPLTGNVSNGLAPLTELDEYKNGLFSIQDEASMMVAGLAAGRSAAGETSSELTVIDMCAAPGGKSLAMAELMGNKGQIISADIYENKLKDIEVNARRLGIDMIKTVRNDGCVHRPEWDDQADLVLCDVPCSGLGVIRRKPEIKYSSDEDKIDSLAEVQAQILRNAAAYVKPGGALVYSTCTVSRRENEEIIEAFLQEKGYLHRDEGRLLRDDEAKSPERSSAGSAGECRFILEEQKTLTPDTDGTDGFFMCRMIRQC